MPCAGRPQSQRRATALQMIRLGVTLNAAHCCVLARPAGEQAGHGADWQAAPCRRVSFEPTPEDPSLHKSAHMAACQCVTHVCVGNHQHVGM